MPGRVGQWPAQVLVIIRPDQDHARFGRGDAGQLANPHLRTVNLHHDVLDQAGRGLAGPHAGKLVLHDVFGLLHLVFGFEQNVVCWHK